ncbi:putative defense protein Hdd11 [Amyelois transitella]|uniref:putative defense protein Hdd11 n=1 Tax=Amyelois transitella TaxID=680683 RepID=UPI00067CB4BF|nr:putative defense protein Hdd11 [Amyelois transitella]
MWCTYFAVAVALVATADAYSAGAPTGACKDMIPRHPVSAQTRQPPYTITTSTKTVKGGNSMEVTISGKSPSDKIRGLLLQARSGDDIVGSFKVDPKDPFAQLLNCGTPDNAVTHKKHDESEDKQTVKFTWTPPADLKGEIKFRATIALNGAVFWVGVESAPVRVV